MPEAGHPGHLRDERPREQPLRRHLAVPVDVVEHQLVVLGGAVAPVQDLLAGQFLEDQRRLVDDVVLRLRCGGGCRAGSGQHDRGRRRGRLLDGGAHGRGFGTVLGGRRLPGPDLLPPVLAGPCLGGHGLVQLPLGRRAALLRRGVRHGGVDGGRDRLAPVTAVEPPVLALRTLTARVEQHSLALHATLARLRELTSDEDHAYFVDIAHFMADLPLDQVSGARWLDGEQETRNRWRGLVIARRAHLHAGC